VSTSRFCAFFFLAILLLTGCDMQDRATIFRAKNALGRRRKDVDELAEIRGSLRRIIERKVQAADLLGEVNRVLGEKYIDLGSYNLAEEVLAEAEYLMPANPYLKKDLAECHYFLFSSAVDEADRKEHLVRAREYFEKAVDMKPDYVEARYGLGLTLFFGYGETAGAIEQMKQVLAYEPDNVEAHFALGRFYYEIDELGKALGEYIALTDILSKGSAQYKKAEENILKINREIGTNE
jgi:tetratricopeptide (TPR) repeat protein